MTQSKTTLSITALSKTTPSGMGLSKMTLGIISLSNQKLSILTPSMRTLSAINSVWNVVMLNVVKLKTDILCYVETRYAE